MDPQPGQNHLQQLVQDVSDVFASKREMKDYKTMSDAWTTRNKLKADALMSDIIGIKNIIEGMKGEAVVRGKDGEKEFKLRQSQAVQHTILTNSLARLQLSRSIEMGLAGTQRLDGMVRDLDKRLTGEMYREISIHDYIQSSREIAEMLAYQPAQEPQKSEYAAFQAQFKKDYAPALKALAESLTRLQKLLELKLSEHVLSVAIVQEKDPKKQLEILKNAKKELSVKGNRIELPDLRKKIDDPEKDPMSFHPHDALISTLETYIDRLETDKEKALDTKDADELYKSINIYRDALDRQTMKELGQKAYIHVQPVEAFKDTKTKKVFIELKPSKETETLDKPAVSLPHALQLGHFIRSGRFTADRQRDLLRERKDGFAKNMNLYERERRAGLEKYFDNSQRRMDRRVQMYNLLTPSEHLSKRYDSMPQTLKDWYQAAAKKLSADAKLKTKIADLAKKWHASGYKDNETRSLLCKELNGLAVLGDGSKPLPDETSIVLSVCQILRLDTNILPSAKLPEHTVNELALARGDNMKALKEYFGKWKKNVRADWKYMDWDVIAEHMADLTMLDTEVAKEWGKARDVSGKDSTGWVAEPIFWVHKRFSVSGLAFGLDLKKLNEEGGKFLWFWDIKVPADEAVDILEDLLFPDVAEEDRPKAKKEFLAKSKDEQVKFIEEKVKAKIESVWNIIDKHSKGITETADGFLSHMSVVESSLKDRDLLYTLRARVEQQDEARFLDLEQNPDKRKELQKPEWWGDSRPDDAVIAERLKGAMSVDDMLWIYFELTKDGVKMPEDLTFVRKITRPTDVKEFGDEEVRNTDLLMKLRGSLDHKALEKWHALGPKPADRAKKLKKPDWWPSTKTGEERTKEIAEKLGLQHADDAPGKMAPEAERLYVYLELLKETKPVVKSDAEVQGIIANLKKKSRALEEKGRELKKLQLVETPDAAQIKLMRDLEEELQKIGGEIVWIYLYCMGSMLVHEDMMAVRKEAYMRDLSDNLGLHLAFAGVDNTIGDKNKNELLLALLAVAEIYVELSTALRIVGWGLQKLPFAAAKGLGRGFSFGGRILHKPVTGAWNTGRYMLGEALGRGPWVVVKLPDTPANMKQLLDDLKLPGKAGILEEQAAAMRNLAKIEADVKFSKEAAELMVKKGRLKGPELAKWEKTLEELVALEKAVDAKRVKMIEDMLRAKGSLPPGGLTAAHQKALLDAHKLNCLNKELVRNGTIGRVLKGELELTAEGRLMPRKGHVPGKDLFDDAARSAIVDTGSAGRAVSAESAVLRNATSKLGSEGAELLTILRNPKALLSMPAARIAQIESALARAKAAGKFTSAEEAILASRLQAARAANAAEAAKLAQMEARVAQTVEVEVSLARFSGALQGASRGAKLMKFAGKLLGPAAMAVQAYVAIEYIRAGVKARELAEQKMAEIEEQVAKVDGMKKVGAHSYRYSHNNKTFDVNLSTMFDNRNFESDANFARAVNAGVGLAILAIATGVGGPVGVVIGIGAVIIEIAVNYCIDAWEQNEKFKFINSIPPILFAICSTGQMFNMSAVAQYEELRDPNFLTGLFGDDKARWGAERKMAFAMIIQDLMQEAPEVLNDILGDDGLGGMQRFYDALFHSPLRLYFLARVKSMDNVSSVRRAMLDTAVLYTQQIYEARFVRRSDQLDQLRAIIKHLEGGKALDDDQKAELRAMGIKDTKLDALRIREVDFNQLVDGMGQQKVFGKPLADVTYDDNGKELKGAAAIKAIVKDNAKNKESTRGEILTNSLQPLLGNNALPTALANKGKALGFSPTNGWKTLTDMYADCIADPVTRQNLLDNVYETRREKPGFVSMKDQGAYDLCYALDVVTRRHHGVPYGHEWGQKGSLLDIDRWFKQAGGLYDTDSYYLARQRLTQKLESSVRIQALSRNDAWAEHIFGNKRPLVLTSLYLPEDQDAAAALRGQLREWSKQCCSLSANDPLFNAGNLQEVVIQHQPDTFKKIIRTYNYSERKSEEETRTETDHKIIVHMVFRDSNGNRFVQTRSGYAYKNPVYRHFQDKDNMKFRESWTFVQGAARHRSYEQFQKDTFGVDRQITDQASRRITVDAVERAKEDAEKKALEFKRAEAAEQALFQSRVLLYLSVDADLEGLTFQPGTPEFDLLRHVTQMPPGTAGLHTRGNPAAFLVRIRKTDAGIEALSHSVEAGTVAWKDKALMAQRGAVLRRTDNGEGKEWKKWTIDGGDRYNSLKTNRRYMTLADAPYLGDQDRLEALTTQIIQDQHTTYQEHADERFRQLRIEQKFMGETLPADRFFRVRATHDFIQRRADGSTVVYEPGQPADNPHIPRYQLYFRVVRGGRTVFFPMPDALAAKLPAELSPTRKKACDEKKRQLQTQYPGSLITEAYLRIPPLAEAHTITISQDFQGPGNKRFAIASLQQLRTLPYDERRTITEILTTPRQGAVEHLLRLSVCEFREDENAQAELTRLLTPLYERSRDPQRFLLTLLKILNEKNFITLDSVKDIAADDRFKAPVEGIAIQLYGSERRIPLNGGHSLVLVGGADKVSFRLEQNGEEAPGGGISLEAGEPARAIEAEAGVTGVNKSYLLESLRQEESIRIVVRGAIGESLLSCPLTLDDEKDIESKADSESGLLVATGKPNEYVRRYEHNEAKRSIILQQSSSGLGRGFAVEQAGKHKIVTYANRTTATFFSEEGEMEMTWTFNNMADLQAHPKFRDLRTRITEDINDEQKSKPLLDELTTIETLFSQKKMFEAQAKSRRFYLTLKDLGQADLTEAARQVADELLKAAAYQELRTSLCCSDTEQDPGARGYARNVKSIIDLFAYSPGNDWSVGFRKRDEFLHQMRAVYHFLQDSEKPKFLAKLMERMEKAADDTAIDMEIDKKTLTVKDLQDIQEAILKEFDPGEGEKKPGERSKERFDKALETSKEYLAYRLHLEYVARMPGRHFHRVESFPGLNADDEEPEEGEELPEVYIAKSRSESGAFLLVRGVPGSPSLSTEPVLKEDGFQTVAPAGRFSLSKMRADSGSQAIGLSTASLATFDEKNIFDRHIFDALTTPFPPGSTDEMHRKSLANIVDLCHADVERRGGAETHQGRRLLEGLWQHYRLAVDREAFLMKVVRELRSTCTEGAPNGGGKIVRLTDDRVTALLRKMRAAVRNEEFVPTINYTAGRTLKTVVPLGKGYTLTLDTSKDGVDVELLREVAPPKGNAKAKEATGEIEIKSDTFRTTIVSESNTKKSVTGGAHLTDYSIVVTVKDEEGKVMTVMPLKVKGTEEKRKEYRETKLREQLRKELIALDDELRKKEGPSPKAVRDIVDRANDILPDVVFPNKDAKSFDTWLWGFKEKMLTADRKNFGMLLWNADATRIDVIFAVELQEKLDKALQQVPNIPFPEQPAGKRLEEAPGYDRVLAAVKELNDLIALQTKIVGKPDRPVKSSAAFANRPEYRLIRDGEKVSIAHAPFKAPPEIPKLVKIGSFTLTEDTSIEVHFQGNGKGEKKEKIGTIVYKGGKLTYDKDALKDEAHLTLETTDGDGSVGIQMFFDAKESDGTVSFEADRGIAGLPPVVDSAKLFDSKQVLNLAVNETVKGKSWVSNRKNPKEQYFCHDVDGTHMSFYRFTLTNEKEGTGVYERLESSRYDWATIPAASLPFTPRPVLPKKE